MSITSYIKDHPYASGTIAVIGGIIFIVIVRGGNNSSGSSSNNSRPSDAEIAANASIQAAQIQAQGAVALATAQSGAAVQAAQVGAGVQLNADNKAAEIAMAQITAVKDIYSQGIKGANDTKLAAINNIGAFGGKGAYDEQKAAALQTIFSGQNAFIPTKWSQTGTDGKTNSAASTISSIGNAVSSVGSVFGSIFSDSRLKENIRLIGQNARGRNVYEYNYKGSRTLRRGYIAQDIARAEPELVRSDTSSGYLMLPASMYN